MRGSGSLIAAVAAVLVLTGCAATGGTEAEPTRTGSTGPAVAERYENAEHGFAFERPEGWELADPPAGTVVAVYPVAGAVDGFAENLNVTVEQLPVDLTATEYLDVAWARLKPELTDVEELGRRELTAGDLEAASIEYRARFPQAEGPLHLLQVAVVDGRTVFVITYTGMGDGFERYRPEAESIIASFRRI